MEELFLQEKAAWQMKTMSPSRENTTREEQQVVNAVAGYFNSL